MDKSLEEERDDLNNPSPQSTDWRSHQALGEEVTSILFTLQEAGREGDFLAHRRRTALPRYQDQRHSKEGNHRPVSLMHRDAGILSPSCTSQLQQHNKRQCIVIPRSSFTRNARLIQCWKTVNLVYCLTNQKGKFQINPAGSEQYLTKSRTCVYSKNCQQTRDRWPPQPRMPPPRALLAPSQQEWAELLPWGLAPSGLPSRAGSSSQFSRKGEKVTQVGKEEVRLLLCTEDMVAGCRINTQK